MLLDDKATNGTLGIVLSGGGARGAFQAGALEELLKSPRFKDPSALSGTSAGAINAAILASTGKTSALVEFWDAAAKDQPITAHKTFFEELYGSFERLGCDEWRAIARHEGVFDHPFDRRRTLGDLLAAAAEHLLRQDFSRLIKAIGEVKQTSLFEGQRLNERLRNRIGDKVKPLPGFSLAVSVVDAHEGSVQRYVTTPVPKAGYEYRAEIPIEVIQASASIPLLLPAVPVHDKEGDFKHLCWDGGLLVNTPLAPIIYLGAERVVTVLCTVGRRDSKPGFDSLDDALERLADTFFENNYNVDSKLILSGNRIANLASASGFSDPTRKRMIYLHDAIKPTAAHARSYLDFSKSAIDEMREDGRAVTREWLKTCDWADGLEDSSVMPTPNR